MNKQQVEYFFGTSNVMPCDGMSITREKSNGLEFVTILLDDKVLYSFWHNPNKKPKNNITPKHNGGKKDYVKLVVEELRNHDLSLETKGLILTLLDNIQWNTRLIINKRSKKALLIDDISKLVKIGRNKTLDIIKELKEANLLIKDKDGYKFSHTFVQKGGEKIETS